MSQPLGESAGSEALDLHDWRRTIADLYASVRLGGGAAAAWQGWRDVRDRLFGAHPQSPLDAQARAAFSGLAYYAHDPLARVLARPVVVPPQRRSVAGSAGLEMTMTRVARLDFALRGAACSLDAHWLDGYGGGLFVPFTDSTRGQETYGAGRYLIDSVKGADLGAESGLLVLDFNYAYQPSCSYDPRWACPLAPPGNHLEIAVRAGERLWAAPA